MVERVGEEKHREQQNQMDVCGVYLFIYLFLVRCIKPSLEASRVYT